MTRENTPSRLCPFRQQRDIAIVSEDAVPAFSGELTHDSQLRELSQRSADGRCREAARLDQERDRSDGPLLECVMDTQGRTNRPLMPLNPSTVLLEEIDDPASGDHRTLGRLPGSLQEELQPRLPVSLQSDTLQEVVVGRAVGL